MGFTFIGGPSPVDVHHVGPNIDLSFHIYIYIIIMTHRGGGRDNILGPHFGPRG